MMSLNVELSQVSKETRQRRVLVYDEMPNL